MARRTLPGRRWGRFLTTVVVLGTALGLAAGPATAGKGGGGSQPTAPAPASLVLYDDSGAYGWIGELYAMQTANLVSHFGGRDIKPVRSYQAGDADRYKSVVYVGSTYDEALPAAFLADLPTTTANVVWMHNNIWQLVSATPDFEARYGWTPGYFQPDAVTEVRYKGTSLTRDVANGGGILGYLTLDASRVKVVAEAVRADGTTFPWAVRSGNLTYVGEIPYPYMRETDRVLAFEDMLFDALDPARAERHRALVRIEDIGPDADPAALRAAADYLAAQGVPFSVAVYTRYRDPNGFYNNGVAEDRLMSKSPEVVSALKYMTTKGGTLLMHGHTHQFEAKANPYNGVSGDDFEFYSAHVDEQDYVRYDGPVPGDSTAYALSRIDAGMRELKASRLPTPTIWTTPHYAASATDYKAIGTRVRARYERGLYFAGLTTGQPVDHSKIVGQFFPYVVKDIYGTTVLPENLGDITPEAYNHHPARLPDALIDVARRNLVVRDGFASFFWHPYVGQQHLQAMVEGIKGLGYTFVSAPSLLA